MKLKIFLDSSNIDDIKKWINKVDGVTTNPTLMKKAGIKDYEKFCKEVLSITNKPVSFEVFADDFDEMERQARIISSWGENVYVKIPIINTKGESSKNLINNLLEAQIKINITAITHKKQIGELPISITGFYFWHVPRIFSFFAGRIADTGIDPVKYIKDIKRAYFDSKEDWPILWASSREVLNIYQAEEAGADIITCTPELLEKYEKFKGMDLNELSQETVQMFYDAGQSAGFKL